MNPFVSDTSTAIVVFISTNIDDLFLLSAFFADPRLRYRSIVAGQYVGISILVVASVLAALLALVFPDGWVALLGAVPLTMGVGKLAALRATTDSKKGDSETLRMLSREQRAERGLRSQVLAVASVTVANGGDNIGVYVPLFARNIEALVSYSLVFAVMTGVWCALGYVLVHNRILGDVIKRYGHVVLPVVLIALGAYILSGALILLH